MGSGSEFEEDRPRLIANQKTGKMQANEKRRVIAQLGAQELRQDERTSVKTVHPYRENEDVLSLLDDPMITRTRGGVPEDSLEYSLISTSPIMHRDVAPVDRVINDRGVCDRHDDSIHRHVNRRSQLSFSLGSGSSLSATVDLQITTEQMKNIAMKYKAM